jgi:hypothetical protein
MFNIFPFKKSSQAGVELLAERHTFKPSSFVSVGLRPGIDEKFIPIDWGNMYRANCNMQNPTSKSKQCQFTKAS